MIPDVSDDELMALFPWLAKRYACGRCGCPMRFQTRDMRDTSWKVHTDGSITSRCGMCGAARALFTEMETDGDDAE